MTRELQEQAERALLLVARVLKVRLPDFFNDNRLREVTHARQVAMYLLYKDLGYTQVQIGLIFQRDHTTVGYSVKTVERRIQEDQVLRKTIEQIRRGLLFTERYPKAKLRCFTNGQETVLAYSVDDAKALLVETLAYTRQECEGLVWRELQDEEVVVVQYDLYSPEAVSVAAAMNFYAVIKRPVLRHVVSDRDVGLVIESGDLEVRAPVKKWLERGGREVLCGR